MTAAIKFPVNRTEPIHFPTTPGAVKATALKLDKRMSAEQAFQAIARNCIAHIQANEAGVAKVHDGECLHQMRVGLRRLRSAQSMFRGLIVLPVDLATDIDWLVGQLGPARDWDVLAASTLAKVSEAAGHPAQLVELRMAVQRQANELHGVAAAAVASERYSRLMLELSGWVERRGWRDGAPLATQTRLRQRVGKFADAVLERDQERLLKRGRQLRSATPEARHRVRIAGKKTRYAAEFFGSLYKDKQVRPYVKSLTRLQDELGWLNDAAVAQGLLEELAQRRVELREGIGFARGYLQSRMQDADRPLRRAWKRFAPLRAPR